MDNIPMNRIPMNTDVFPHYDPDESLKNFYVTFNGKYRNQPIPRNQMWVDPDGYYLVQAPNFNIARDVAFDAFGYFFERIYEESEFVPGAFPHGEQSRFERRY